MSMPINVSLDTGSVDMAVWPALINYTINDTGTGHVTIYINSSDGQTIRQIDCGIKSGGSYVAKWDGREDNGSLVTEGDYSIAIDYVPDDYFVKADWGSTGSAEGQFIRPSDIAVDGQGNVYVAEYDNHRIQKFDPSGRFISNWGSYGSGNGQFEYPSGIAIGNNGMVYMADLGNSRIEMFSEDGGYISQWGNAGSGNGEFSMPHGIAVDGSGNVYVADMGNHRVQKFTSAGKYLDSIGGYGKKDGLFMSPADVTVYGNTLLVSDIDRNRVQTFITDGSFINAWGVSGSGPGQFNGAAGIATDGWNIYVADMNNHRIQKFDLTGKYTGMIDCYGIGQNVAPAGIAADGTGNIYVADISNNDVQRLVYDPTRGNLIVKKSTNITLSAQDITGLASSSGIMNTSIMASSATSINGPDTYIDLTGTAGNGSWYRSNVTVTLSPYSKSGTSITETRYKLNNFNWTTYTGPFNITDEGTTTVFFNSTDSQGNVEPVQSANVRVDKTPPDVIGTILTDPVANGWYTGSVTVNFSAKDTLSGVVNVTPDQTISVNGISQVVGSAYDLAGNLGTDVVNISIDNKPPTTKILLNGTTGGNGWFTSDVQVNFTAVDGESGVTKTEYSLDGGIWKSAASFMINKEGVTTVYYRSTDAVGNVEPVNTMMIKVDKSAPIITGAPDRQPDLNGWYTGPVTISFSATDIYSGVNPASVSLPMTLPLNGTPLDGPYQSVMGTASDNAGNTATAVVGNLNIDMYPPTTTCTLNGAGGGTGDNTWYRANVTVTLSAKDAGSGVHDIKYSLDGVNWLDYHPFIISDEGITTIKFKSTDNVGHIEPVQTVYVRVDKTPPVVTYDIITKKNSNGWYTEPVVIHFMATDDRSGIVYVNPDITLSSDGIDQSVTGYATDVSGNTGSVTVEGLNVNIKAPVTTCILNRTPNEDGWFTGDVSASLSSSNNIANGPEITEYSFNGTGWQTYTDPLTIHDEGKNPLYYFTTDNMSHQEPVNAQNIRIDNTPPTLSYSINGGTPVNGWYTHNITVHFIALDPISGIKSVTPDVNLTDDGKSQKVNGSATDMAGNTISIQSEGINLDRNPPVTTCVFSGTPGNNGWYKTSGGVTLNASDGNGIGVNYTRYRLDNGSWTVGTQFTIPDGMHTIYYQSVDLLNNTEPVQSQTVKVDSTPPTIKGVRSIQPSQYGWYNASVTIHFEASDSLSGLASVSPDITISNEGIGQSATGTATDYAGNIATDNENNINIDKTAPSTNYTLEGSQGLNGWNTSDVKVTFSSDDLSLLNIWHSLDNKNWSASNPFTTNFEGSQTVYYYAEDKAGNKETPKSFTLKIDKTAPKVTYSISGTQGLAGNYRSDVVVALSANDSGGSNLANAQYSLDGITWKPLANVTLTAEGDYNIQYNASDNAGNKAADTIKFTIDKTAPTVNTTTPVANSDGVLTDGQPIVTFNGRLDTGSLNNSTVTLTSADGKKVNGTLRYVENGNISTVTFIPSDQLEPYTTYTVKLSTDIRDPAGNYLASPYEWTFTTGNMDSAGNELATPVPTLEPTISPTPRPGGIPIIGQIPMVPLVIFLAIIAVGSVAFIYLTRFRK